MGIGFYGISLKGDRQYCIAKQYEISLLNEAKQKEIAKNTNCVTTKNTKMCELLHLICHTTVKQLAQLYFLLMKIRGGDDCKSTNLTSHRPLLNGVSMFV